MLVDSFRVMFYHHYYYSESTYNYMMSPGKEPSSRLYGREVSTGDPQKHRAMEIIGQNSDHDTVRNGMIHSSKSNPQLNMLQRHTKSSSSINDENDDPSLFLLRPAENRLVMNKNVYQYIILELSIKN